MVPTSLKAAFLTAALLVGLGRAGPNISQGHGALPSDPPLHLVLHTSENRLDLYQGDDLVRSYTVSVGRPGYATPTGSYAISSIIWNPSWVPPNSGWAAGKSPKAPGEPGNPMGRVKMMFSDLYYIHGTPDVGQLGEPVSHGCVRMSNADAIELAQTVEAYGAPGGANDGTVRLDNPVPLEVQ